MKLSACIRQFFDQYLPHIRGMSTHTVQAYRDVFKLIIPFAANHYCIKVKSLRLEHLSPDLILAFLNYVQQERNNLTSTRNHRLAVLKSFAVMVRFMYPEHRDLAERIINIPQKRAQKTLVGFLYEDEILEVFAAVDLRRKEGFRDYALLHLLYDSGARATEIATLNVDYFNPQQKTLAILGKGNKYRIITLEPKTSQILRRSIKKYRIKPKPRYQHRLFINQRREEFTRHGIYRICRKYLSIALHPKRLKIIHPAHSFRHSRAVHLLYLGRSITEIQNRLGHENPQSTTIYLQLDLKRKRHIQRRFTNYMQSVINHDPKIERLLQEENREDIMAWLDKL
jgi:integrase/recombinase XerD